ncbi:hypothetical protein SLS62_011341 [Diatrype stigma]|uniref:FAD-binding domain-containing protein n=1 Tax=Diatrype stigma TaxID=117547 RepID=A0AAN9U5X8_9PEZI
MKILISGAGIAGSSLAFWLGKLGHNVTVIEWYPQLRTTGLQLDLRGHGIEVLKRMGLEAAFRAKAAPEQGLQIVDSTGRRRAFFPANKSGKGLQSFTSEFEIMRGDLCRLLYDAAVENRARYVFGSSIESFEDKGDSVEVRFKRTGGAEGKGEGQKETTATTTTTETERFDLLVGADGQWSRTRKMMLGSDTEGVYPLHGQHIAYFSIPRPADESKGQEEYVATAYIAPGKRGVQLRRNNPHQLQVYLGCTPVGAELERISSVRRGDVAAEKEAIAEIFRGAGWQTEEILEQMLKKGGEGEDGFYCERMIVVKLKGWSRGRVALTGDAAWTPSANTGMGTTSAVVGAYILAGEIGRHCGGRVGQGQDRDATGTATDNLAAALRAYQERFTPFMDQVQKGIVERKDFYPTTPFAISVMTNMMSLASFLRLDVLARFFLREDVKGWDLPTYEELLD